MPELMDNAISGAGIHYSYVGDPAILENSRVITAHDLRPIEAKLLTAQALVQLSDKVTIGGLSGAVQNRMDQASMRYADAVN